MVFGGYPSFQTEIISEGYFNIHISRGTEIIGLARGEDISQTVVVAAFEHHRMAGLHIEFESNRSTYAVIEPIAYVELHLLGLAVGREARHTTGIGIVEVGIYRTSYHICELRAEIDKSLEPAGAEIYVRKYRQIDIGERP